jgi:HK97 family phage major capsid protein
MKNRLKELSEERGAKLKTLTELQTKATAEKRSFTAEEGSSFDKIAGEIEGIDTQLLREVRAVSLASQQAPALSRGEERDLGRFDYQKLMNHLHRSARGMTSQLDGFELEMVQEGEREARSADVRAGGLILPRILVRRGARENRDMTATGQTSVAGDQGGMTIATTKQGLLDDFYNASVMRLAGATVLEGLQGNLDLPRLTAGTASAAKAENAAADETSPLTAMLSLTPNRLPSYIDISERLLMQSSAAIEAVLRNNLTAQMLATQEAAFFHGSGTNEANGIAGTSGIGDVAGGTNGAAPTLAHLLELESDVDGTNALLGKLHYISNGQIRGKLKATPKVASTDSKMLLDDNGLLNSYVPFFTNAVSRTLTKGSSSVASAIFFGNFADYYIGYWSGISLEMVRDKTNAISGLYTLVASAYYDGGVVRPKSFSAMLDALGA